VAVVDVLGNILALPIKLLFLTWKFANHSISEETEEVLVEYLDTQNQALMQDARFRLNQYRPLQDLSRLARNRHVAWPYRLILGFPATLLIDVLLPGRIMPWGDYYNPYTNTVHLYSDHPAVALHEAGHAHDFSRRRFKGTYALLRLIPFVDLYQEYQASKEAVRYFRVEADHEREIAAYKILHPAYGSYVGAYIFPPIGTVVGIAVGHVTGRSAAELAKRRHHHEQAPLKPAPSMRRPAPAMSSP
jgi:hypothetical protein